tara:strand:+ start:1122 stop:2087 length:966 start_codon:yes stop_codon:yes gene_type:complete
MVNIDTVYQKVLALANKEQRGYITPQEFNLMANKAQLDLINNYFHKTKTSFLKPQNQSEASDEMEMVQEKMGWLRSEKELTSQLWANSNITELNGKVILQIPSDVYKIATLYLTAPGGVAASGQNPSQAYDRVEVHRVDRKDLLDMKRHPLTNPSVKRPAYVIHDSTGLSNSANTFEYLELHPTVTYGVTTHENTGFTPVTYWYTWAVTGNSSNIQGYYVNAEPPVGQGFNISEDLLITLPGSTFRLDYYRKPTSPEWAYVVVNEKPLYNEGGSKHFDLHPMEEEPLVIRILELCGVIIERPELQQGVAQDRANTKQEQNT